MGMRWVSAGSKVVVAVGTTSIIRCSQHRTQSLGISITRSDLAREKSTHHQTTGRASKRNGEASLRGSSAIQRTSPHSSAARHQRPGESRSSNFSTTTVTVISTSSQELSSRTNLISSFSNTSRSVIPSVLRMVTPSCSCSR